ncbi:MAG: MinD/ParA family protein [Gammaproteobacteria bacterium]
MQSLNSSENTLTAPCYRSVIRTLAVTSGKGGVGKTTIAINLATAVSSLGYRVMLLDADLGFGNVAVMLGIEASYDLSHVIDGKRALKDILLPGPGGVKIIPASSSTKARLDNNTCAGLVYAFSELSEMTDFLIIDTGADMSYATLNFCSAAQEILLIVCDDPASIANAVATIKVLHKEHAIHRFRVLINMTPVKTGISVFRRLVESAQSEVDATFDNVGVIPYDVQLRKTARSQQALVSASPQSYTSKAFVKLAHRVNRWPTPRIPSGKLEFFLEQTIRTAAKKREHLI